MPAHRLCLAKGEHTWVGNTREKRRGGVQILLLYESTGCDFFGLKYFFKFDYYKVE